MADEVEPSEALGEDNSFHAPWRHRQATGLPTWASHQGFVLPQISVVPGDGPAGGWWIMLMVGESHRHRHIGDGELLPFFEEWRRDPERTLLVWFDMMPPKAGARPKHQGQSQVYLDPKAVSNTADIDVEELF